MGTRFDAVIVGGGPGGVAAGLTLARHGATVLVVDRSLTQVALGEGLAPSAAPLLQELGVWERFMADGHPASYGNRSAWGATSLEERDFIRSPYGHGWHLNRPLFDTMLAAALQGAGGTVCRNTRITALQRECGEWILELVSDRLARRTVRAGWLIDATGRAHSLSRALGVPCRVHDRLVAVVGALSPGGAGTDADSFTLVEAVACGWWYATLQGDGRLIIGYLTDADDPTARPARTVSGWTALLEQTVHIRERVLRGSYRLDAPLGVAAADSSSLTTVSGDGWYAVGDAAASHDPLASHGIATALLSGKWAGDAIAAGQDGTAAYQERMRHVYARYLASWLTYYDLERRWPMSPFWARRHDTLASLVPVSERVPAPGGVQ